MVMLQKPVVSVSPVTVNERAVVAAVWFVVNVMLLNCVGAMLPLIERVSCELLSLVAWIVPVIGVGAGVGVGVAVGVAVGEGEVVVPEEEDVGDGIVRGVTAELA